MKWTVRILLTVSMLSAVAASAPPAFAEAGRYTVFAFGEYPVPAGRDVTAIAVDLVNSRFRHRRVTGPGVVYGRNSYYWW